MDVKLGGFFLNDSPGYETKFTKKVLSETRREFGRDKVFQSDVSITLIEEDQDEQDQQPSAYSPDYVAVLLYLTNPEPHCYVARADRQKLLALAREILQHLDRAEQ